MHNTSFGKRANVYSGKAPLQDILQLEVAGCQNVKKPIEQENWVPQGSDGGKSEPEIGVERGSEMLVTGESHIVKIWKYADDIYSLCRQ